MIHKMVRYEVQANKVAKVKKAILEFVARTKIEKGTMDYRAYQITDRAFVHFMSFRDRKSEALHANSPNTKKFVKILYPSCAEKPVFTEMRLVRKRTR